MENTIFASTSLTILKKLENLISSDSSILKELEQKKEQATNKKENATENISSLTNQINDKTTRITDLKKEGSKLLEILKNIDSSEFQIITKTLDLAFDCDSDVLKIEQHLPEVITEYEQEITNLNDMLKQEKQDLSDAEDVLSELVVRKEEALRNQDKLIELVNLAKKGDVNKTRDEVITTLLNVEFNESDAKKGAKLLLFPEEEFIPYFNNNEENINEDIFQDALDRIQGIERKPKNQELKDSLDKELTNEEAHENKLKQETPVIEEVEEQSLADIISDEVEISVEENTERQKVEKVENASDIFTTEEETKDVEETQTDSSTISDREECVQELITLGKNKDDIDLISSFDAPINKTVEELKNIGLDPVKTPLIAYQYGVENLTQNLDTLNAYGYELDGAEIEKMLATPIITDSKTIKNNLEILKNYKVNLKKNNGKLALKVLSVDTKKLINKLDLLTEIGEIKLCNANPFVLTLNCQEIAENILFCKANKIPYTEEKNGRLIYRSFIYSRKELNELVEKELDLNNIIIDDLALSELIDINLYEKLANYSNTDEYGIKQTLNQNDETYFKYMNLINKLKNYIDEDLQVYNFNGILCSVNNTNRNLMYLVNNDANNSDEELLIISLLYNSYKNREEMKKIIDIIKDNK